jgi:enoyl-CoA hydratase/carnithine racemase
LSDGLARQGGHAVNDRKSADISGDVDDARQVLLKAWNPLVMTMRSLQLPIIAARNGVAAIKQAHHRALETDFASQLNYEADTRGRLQQQPDFTGATQAFAAKRPPRPRSSAKSQLFMVMPTGRMPGPPVTLRYR